MIRQHRQNHRGRFHGAPEAEPGGRRDPVESRGCHFRQIQRHHAESARLNQQIGRAQGVLGIAAAAYPDQLRKFHSNRRSRAGIEGVFRIHQRYMLASRGGSRQQPMEHGSSPAGTHADDFRDSATREITFSSGEIIERLGMTPAKSKRNSRHNIRFLFAYLKLELSPWDCQSIILSSSHQIIYAENVRTTIDLDEDILRAAKDLAHERSQSLGRVLSDLARKGLQPPKQSLPSRNGIPLLTRKPGAKPVTSQMVKDLLEFED